MRVISVNVGGPRTIVRQGRAWRTSIWKTPVAGRVRVAGHNLEGDSQSDRKRHGGPSRVVCVYPFEHYAFWRKELPELDLPYGAFGENLTLEGFLEGDARIGDRLRIGTAEFAVSQPRLPCVKLQMRLGREDMIERILACKRTGYYLALINEGDIGAGDAVAVLRGPADAPFVSSLLPPPKTARTHRL